MIIFNLLGLLGLLMLFWLNQRSRRRSASNSSQQSKSSVNSTKKALSQNTKSQKKQILINPKQQKQSQPLDTSLQKLSQNNLQKIMHTYNISEKQLQHLLQIFKKFDEDEDNELSFSQLQNLMNQGGQSINLITSRDIVCQFKANSKHGISFIDFVGLLYSTNYQNDNQKQLFRIFGTFDKMKRGAFDFQDYITIWRTTSRQSEIKQLKLAFDLMDTNKDGFVTFQQFKKAVSLSTE